MRCFKTNFCFSNTLSNKYSHNVRIPDWSLSSLAEISFLGPPQYLRICFTRYYYATRVLCFTRYYYATRVLRFTRYYYATRVLRFTRYYYATRVLRFTGYYYATRVLRFTGYYAKNVGLVYDTLNLFVWFNFEMWMGKSPICIFIRNDLKLFCDHPLNISTSLCLSLEHWYLCSINKGLMKEVFFSSYSSKCK